MQQAVLNGTSISIDIVDRSQVVYIISMKALVPRAPDPSSSIVAYVRGARLDIPDLQHEQHILTETWATLSAGNTIPQ